MVIMCYPSPKSTETFVNTAKSTCLTPKYLSLLNTTEGFCVTEHYLPSRLSTVSAVFSRQLTDAFPVHSEHEQVEGKRRVADENVRFGGRFEVLQRRDVTVLFAFGESQSYISHGCW